MRINFESTMRPLSICLTALSFLIPVADVLAQTAIDKDKIIEQLERGVKARKIDVEGLRESVKNKIEIESASPKGLGAPSPLPSPAQDLPTVSFEIYFDYNSSAIIPRSIPALIQLGQALSDPRLRPFRFLVAGHTDAAGTREYNRRLSEQRAEAVKAFLAQNFQISAGRILHIGFGMEQLKDPSNPLSGINSASMLSISVKANEASMA